MHLHEVAIVASIFVATLIAGGYFLLSESHPLESAGASVALGADLAVPTLPETPTRPPIADPDPSLPQAAQKARAVLAARLGKTTEEVVVNTVKRADWSDGCLGLGGPEESCMMAITPGYEITFSSGISQYRYRTNMDGSVIRAE
jgi:hypothetical protein